MTDCGCDICDGDCPELTEDGALCLACRHGRHPATEDE